VAMGSVAEPAAGDLLVKPVEPRRLVAAVRAVLTRPG
jgi:DNA-binding response OmpR family regulator